MRREVEAGIATCQLYLATVREGEDGLEDEAGWLCDLGYQAGQRRLRFRVARAGIMEWVGKEGETGVRKLEGKEARLGCRVRGTSPLGSLSWLVGGSALNNTINPVTIWEEEQGGGSVYGIQQSLHLANLTPLAGTSVYCRYSQRDYTGVLVPRKVLEAVVIPESPITRRTTTSRLPWLSWVTAGGLLLLIQVGLGLACLLARCAPARFGQPPIETPL